MNVLLDDVAVDAFAGESLADAVAAGRAEAERRGRVLVEVQVDGEAVSESVLADPSGVSAAGSEIRLHSVDPVALVRDSLGEASDALGGSMAAHTSVAHQLQQDDLAAAMNGLGEVMHAWGALQRTITHGSGLLGRDLDELAGPEAGLTAQIDGLIDRLRALKGAIESQDWSEVADVLEYDLAPQVEPWRATLRTMADRLAS